MDYAAPLPRQFSYPHLAAEAVLAMNATVGITPETVTLGVGEKKIVQVVVNVPAPPLATDPQGLAAFQFTARATPTILRLGNPNEAFRPFTILPFAPLGGNPFCGAVRGTTSCPDQVGC